MVPIGATLPRRDELVASPVVTVDGAGADAGDASIGIACTTISSAPTLVDDAGAGGGGGGGGGSPGCVPSEAREGSLGVPVPASAEAIVSSA